LVEPGFAATQPLEGLVGKWLNHPALQHSNVGVEIMELPSGKILYAYNGHKRFLPASTAKVFTTACAYETLGADYTYKTQLIGDPYITEGRLHGDLVLCPSQDPTLTHDDLRQLLRQLADKNVKVVEGHLRLAPVAGGHNQYFPGWLVEDFGQPWMPVCSNLVVDHNVAQGVTALKNVKVSKVDPATEPNALFTSLMSSDVASAWLVYDPDYHSERIYCGEGTTEKSPLVVADPDEYNMALFESAVADQGIHVEKGLGKHKAPDKASIGVQPLAEHLSKPLSKIITITLHESDNLYAQQILRTLGLLQADPNIKLKSTDERTTIEDRALYRLNTWLASIKVPPHEVVLLDGCGLTRKNGVSPHALNTVLAHMAGPTLTGGYLNLLKAGDHYRFKTGSMDTARSITGVVQTKGGQNLALTIMVNNHTPSVKALSMEIGELVSLVGNITQISTKIVPFPEVHTAATTEAQAPVQVEVAAPVRAAAHTSSRRKHRTRTSTSTSKHK